MYIDNMAGGSMENRPRRNLIPEQLIPEMITGYEAGVIADLIRLEKADLVSELSKMSRGEIKNLKDVVLSHIEDLKEEQNPGLVNILAISLNTVVDREFLNAKLKMLLVALNKALATE